MRYVIVMLLLPFAFIAAGCAEEREHQAPANPAAVAVPDVTGENLDDAEEELASRGIDYRIDSGDDEVVFEHLWEVCYQSPPAGIESSSVTLTVEHFCDDD
jgi:hypothetical protein